MPDTRPPLPPFTRENAIEKVRIAEDCWNTCNPERVSLGSMTDRFWRNRADFLQGPSAIVARLSAFSGNRIAVRFAYERHDDSGNGFRSCRNEHWQFEANGLMHWRCACINDLPAAASDRGEFHSDRPGPRPANRPGLGELGS